MKIIGVGISKTGTSSLAAALTELGYRCVHGWPPWKLEHAKALVDVNAACRFRELDVMYPGSKFILTVRQREPWLESCRKHWERYRFANAPPEVRFEYRWCRAKLFGRLDFDADNHWRCYERHLDEVRVYFAGRSPDLLEIDITRGDGWQPLCQFLNIPTPKRDFPWKNRTRPDRDPADSQQRISVTGESTASNVGFPGDGNRQNVLTAPSLQTAVHNSSGRRMRIFVLGVPHTQTTREFSSCPFTTKAWNQCRMLHRRGHEVIHLGVEGSDPECSENVAIVSREDWAKLYGHPGTKFYNAKTDGDYRPYHQRWAKAVRESILARTSQPWEAIVACTWGGTQIEATKGLKQFVVESGIGYRHTWAKYRVFNSYAWMHFHYGREGKFQGNSWYDAVIPNAVDPELFDFREHKKSDRFLFLGRLNDDKGVGIAIETAKRLGRGITIVGQGNPERFLKGHSHVQYLPAVNVDGRRQLLAEAAVVFCPTHYVEPFNNVALEAQVSGTPVISTDWGGFTETVLHGVTGYRCRTMEQFVWAAQNIDRIDPAVCRQWILKNFSPQRVGCMLEEYFLMLLDLGGKGWYEDRPDRTNLDWLKRWHPAHYESSASKVSEEVKRELELR